MRRLTGVVVLSALGILSAASCGKSADAPGDCPAGSERCDCYGNGTCDGELECRSNRCVDPEGASGSGANPSGGAAGSTGGSGKGGTGKGGTAQGGSSSGGTDQGGSSTGGSLSGGEGGEGNDDSGGTSGAGGEGGTSTGGSAGMGGASAGNGGSGGSAMAGAGVGGMALGGGGSGGVSGAGGSTIGCGPIVGAATDTLIDNLEDNDNALAPPRVGYWYTFADGTCVTTPPPDPTGTMPFLPASGAGQNASFGARFSGGNCRTWGAGLGFDLNNCGSRAQVYDATAFQGLSFWYKSTTPFRFIVITLDVIPTMRGGNCVPGGAMQECDNGHGYDLPASTTGSAVAIRFSMLSQTFGQMKPFDRSKLIYVQFQVAQSPGTTFDFTIDNVSFTP